MYGVGRLGSYISRGVYTASGRFHPFGGAVDIIVVEQPDGSFKSSPWYVRFGKFQGVLKTEEKAVSVSVNGVKADFNMYLDHRGESYFLREVDGEEEEDSAILHSSSSFASSSGEENDEQSLNKVPVKSNGSDSITRIDVTTGKIMTRKRSGRPRILGFDFGWKSMKERSWEEHGGSGLVRLNSLEVAEIVAELLEVKWSTNLAFGRRRKDKVAQFSPPDLSGGEEHVSDSAELDACPSKKHCEEEVFKEKNTVLSGNHVSKEENGADRLEALVYDETSERSRVGLDASGGKIDGILYVSCRESADVCIHDETLHPRAELISDTTSVQESTLFVAKESLDIPEFLAGGKFGNFFNEASILGGEETSSNSTANDILIETDTQWVTVDPINGSVKEIEACSICTISGFNNSICQVQDEENIMGEDNMGKLLHLSKPVGDFQEFMCDSVSTEATNVAPSESSENKQPRFGDLDDFNHGEIKCMESIFSDCVDKENHPSGPLKADEALIESLNQNDDSCSSPEKFVQENRPNDVEDFRQKSRIVSTHISIHVLNKVAGEGVEKMAQSLPNMLSWSNHLVVDDLHHSLSHSLDANSELLKQTPLVGDICSCIKSDADEDLVSQAPTAVEGAQISEKLKHVPVNPAVGDLSKAINDTTESRSVRPFSFKRSETTQPARNSTTISDAENALEGFMGMNGEKDVLKLKVKKKKVRETSPTPEQLASLNLKEGKNTVTFTFSTAMLGPQQVDARIYLWKWDTHIVISDVDGTITK
ncbi:phosphatidate phosphatase [Sarracenia purpurea var. burkii]